MKLRLPKLKKIKFSARSVIAGSFVLLICAAAYTDHLINKGKMGRENEYLYTSNEEKIKILGEASFVGTNEELADTVDVSSTHGAYYDSYFSAMNIDRQRSRDEAVEMLRTIVDSADSMPDVKEKAYAEMMNIANNITVETNIQSMVMAKGFDGCLAVINGENLNVIVKTDGLLVNEVAQIKEIAINESGFTADKIKIVEKFE